MPPVDASELERIRQKVERGEPLSETELDRLSAWAQAHPGPTLRLTVAHALVNAEQEHQALPMLERLVRDFPRELQAWLGLARAQMSLDRTTEAERTLQQALSLNPHDPEALKALAVIAMQRGEFARARQWVLDVLRRDPFDDEAKLLRAELETPDLASASAPSTSAPAVPLEAELDPAARRVALRPEFTRALVRLLKAKDIVAAVKEDELWVQPPGAKVARVNLGSLYAAYLAENRPLDAFLRTLAEGLTAAALGVPDSADALLAQALPVLRPSSFKEVAPGAAHREGPAGLFIFYALEDPELVRYVPSGSLEARGVTVDALDAAAFANLDRHPAPLQRVRIEQGRLFGGHARTGIFALCAEDGHDGARLLTSTVRTQLAREVGPGPWRVDLGRREAALVCRDLDADACAQLDGLAPEADGIEGTFVLSPQGQLARVDDS